MGIYPGIIDRPFPWGIIQQLKRSSLPKVTKVKGCDFYDIPRQRIQKGSDGYDHEIKRNNPAGYLFLLIKNLYLQARPS
jgi:hypothetical protein